MGRVKGGITGSMDYSRVDWSKPLAEVAGELGIKRDTLRKYANRQGIKTSWGRYDTTEVVVAEPDRLSEEELHACRRTLEQNCPQLLDLWDELRERRLYGGTST